MSGQQAQVEVLDKEVFQWPTAGFFAFAARRLLTL